MVLLSGALGVFVVGDILSYLIDHEWLLGMQFWPLILSACPFVVQFLKKGFLSLLKVDEIRRACKWALKQCRTYRLHYRIRQTSRLDSLYLEVLERLDLPIYWPSRIP